MAPVESVHMVHGAWADGLAWEKVVPILKSHSLQTAAAQTTLVTLEVAEFILGAVKELNG